MTLPSSGPISLANVNTEKGTPGSSISLGWVKNNTFFSYSNFGSIYGYAYYNAVSSLNSISRTASNTTTNCGGVYNCGDSQCTAYGQCGYNHGTYLQANCNCNCAYQVRYNCACACVCCDASCFPAGSFVTMADGSYKKIENIKPGDKIRGISGINTVVDIEYPVLGDRQLMSMADGSVLWSSEHLFWVRRNGEQWWWTADYPNWIREVEIGHIKGLKDNSSLFIWNGDIEEFAHETGWVKQKVVQVTGELSRPDLQLYFIKTDGDRTLFVNGYVTTAGTDEFSVDYRSLKW